MPTLFEKIGGLSAVRTLTDEFYDVMEQDQCALRLLALHPKKLTMTRLNLYKFLTQWFGGPELFGKKYANAEWLELKHRRLNFTEDHKNQWLYCMDTAMKNLDFASELKEEVMTAFKEVIAAMQALKKTN